MRTEPKDRISVPLHPYSIHLFKLALQKIVPQISRIWEKTLTQLINIVLKKNYVDVLDG